MQMAGCELAQPGGCRRSCCVAHPKPESDEDDERSATPEPSARQARSSASVTKRASRRIASARKVSERARGGTHERHGVEEAAHGDPKIPPPARRRAPHLAQSA